MLTTLRNSAQSWLIKGLLGLLVITFIISFGVGTFTNPKEVLVEVGDKEILVTEYMRQYQQEMDRLRQRFGENAEQLASQLNVRQQVLDRMVNRHLLLAEAREQGLIVTAAEVKDAVRREQAFQVEGRFDFTSYRQILAQNSLTPADYEASLRGDLLLAKHQRNLLAGVIVSDAEIEQRYRIENEHVEVDYVHVNPARVQLPEPPDEQALQAYYDAHPEEFTQPARYKLRYFVLSLEAMEDATQVRDRAVERYFERNRDTEFSTPKRVRASHILKRLPQDAGEEQVAAARAELQDVLARVRAGEDFAALAKSHSEDFTAEEGGDLGFFTRAEMVDAFADAAFRLGEGEVSDIVRSPFGLHIIKVTAVEPGTRQTLEEVRPEIEETLRTERAERKLELELERLPGRIGREGLAPVAGALGVEVQTTSFFDGQDTLPGLGDTGPLYAQLSSRRQGDAGVWRRNPVLGHVFYEVVERQASYVKPYDAVKPEVVEATRAAARRARAIEVAKEAYQRLQDGQRLDEFARSLHLPVQTVAFTVVDPSIEGIGANNEFQRAAFGLTAEQPHALNIKDDKAYLIRFRRRFFPEPDQAAEKKAQIAERLEQAYRQYVLSTELERLRAETTVEVLAPEYVASTAAIPPTRRPY